MFQSTSGSILVSLLGASATVGGLCHAAERPIRYAAELTMSPDELLPLYAELSLALAGFVGVVSAFGGRDREFRPTERVRFLYVVMFAGSVFAGCLGFFTASSGGNSLAVSCVVAGVSSLLVTVIAGWRVVPPGWKHAKDPDSTTEPLSLYAGSGAQIVAAALYVWVVLAGGSPLPMVAGFSLQLLFGLWMFVRLLSRAN